MLAYAIINGIHELVEIVDAVHVTSGVNLVQALPQALDFFLVMLDSPAISTHLLTKPEMA